MTRSLPHHLLGVYEALCAAHQLDAISTTIHRHDGACDVQVEVPNDDVAIFLNLLTPFPNASPDQAVPSEILRTVAAVRRANQCGLPAAPGSVSKIVWLDDSDTNPAGVDVDIRFANDTRAGIMCRQNGYKSFYDNRIAAVGPGSVMCNDIEEAIAVAWVLAAIDNLTRTVEQPAAA